MKTTSITVERNFHIMNDDRFIMEKISMTADLQDGDDEEQCMDFLRQYITNNFKAAYPKVEESLNFHVVRQYNEEFRKDLQEIEGKTGNRFSNNGGEAMYIPSPSTVATPEDIPIDYTQVRSMLKEVSEKTEKINKGTIEEQIAASIDLKHLDEWKLLAKSTPKLQKIFNETEKKLINEGLK